MKNPALQKLLSLVPFCKEEKLPFICDNYSNPRTLNVHEKVTKSLLVAKFKETSYFGIDYLKGPMVDKIPTLSSILDPLLEMLMHPKTC